MILIHFEAAEGQQTNAADSLPVTMPSKYISGVAYPCLAGRDEQVSGVVETAERAQITGDRGGKQGLEGRAVTSDEWRAEAGKQE
jgi:hypothetical protein